MVDHEAIAEATGAIDEMNVETLQVLNGLVVDAINAAYREEDRKRSMSWNVGDRATWRDKRGGTHRGEVRNLNQRTLGIRCDDGRKWRVAYVHAKKEA